MTGVVLRFWTGTVNQASSGLDGSVTLRAESAGPRSSSASGAARLSAVVSASVGDASGSSAAHAPTTHAIHTAKAEIARRTRSEEHTSELQSLRHLVCRLL